METIFADVILPLPLHGLYTYRVPSRLKQKIKPGQRVIVQFGAKRFYSALIKKIHHIEPNNIVYKEIESILDIEPAIYPENLKLWEWIAKYYCCTLGDVMNAALPPGMKLQSRTKLNLVPDAPVKNLSKKEVLLFNLLGSESLFLHELQKIAGKNFSFSALKSLIDKKIILVEEKVIKRYKPRTIQIISLHPEIHNEKNLNIKIESLSKAKRQKELILHFCYKTNLFSEQQIKEISKPDLFKNTTFNHTHLKGLISKKILILKEIEISRIKKSGFEQGSLNILNNIQEQALQNIKKQFTAHNVVLLHGVTSSGKTEIYSHLIEETIKSGKQVLYLVPEISLTAQMINRLRQLFGNKAGIYHSRLNSQERVEIWNNILNFKKNPEKSFKIILGTRSALFLPFSSLGLIIVDEEHENSFKQSEPAPRYHARDMAIVAGSVHNANVLLGTATPSFESFYNVKTRKYGYVKIVQRYRDIKMPEIIIADIKDAYKRKQMKSFLTPLLYKSIEDALKQKEQVILFQNRRGYSSFIECLECGWIPKCRQCDVSLTYHKFKNRLICHYCGFQINMPENCHDCGSPEIKTMGIGTEKIEVELKELFPKAKIERMDMDSTRSKNAFEKLVHNLEIKKTDILIGTQMVTKGLDLEHVSIVGILNADNLINFPDFRSHERSFQLISQVSGRAGRKYKQGKVILQTFQPGHILISEIRKQDYEKSFYRQIQERKLFNYPPYTRLIRIISKHKDKVKLDKATTELAILLKQNKKYQVLGPEYPLINKIQLWYQKEILLKVQRGNPLEEIKKYIVKCSETIQSEKEHKNIAIYIDVDPVH